MPKLKFNTYKSTVSGAVEYAYGELTSLAEECREVVDNAGDSFANTQRIQTLDETAGALEYHTDAPDMPEVVGELVCEYQEQVPTRKGRGLSRAARRDNAMNALGAAIDAVTAWKEARETAREEAESAAEEAGAATLDTQADTQEQTDEELESEADELVSTLEDARGDAEGCEFPGMYG